MRLLSHSWSPGATGDIVLFPGGRIEGNDVWMASGWLHRLKVTGDGTQRPQITVDIYDACVGDIGRAVRGGTGVEQTYRVIAGGGVTNTDQGDPYVLSVPNAQLTACRKLLDGWKQDAASDDAPPIELPFELLRAHMGIAIHINVAQSAAGNVSISGQFTPDVLGGTRADRASMPPVSGNFPL